MNIGVTIGESQPYTLERAILVYGAERVHGAYVTIHDVTTPKRDAPVLGPGRPAGLAFLRSLSESLQAAVPPEILPEHVLCRTPDLIVWWSPAGRRPMHFMERSALGGVSGQAFPQPALAWKLEGRNLYVRALRESERPTARTELYIAPYWNTDHDGRVCLGNMRRPKRIGVGTLREWEEGYFGSLFTGQNGAHPRIRGRGGLAPLWRGLARARGPFPVARLIESGETLERWIKGGRRA